MRIVFLGTPEFAVAALRTLIERHDVVAVVCQPDRERDRKGRVIPCAVKVYAQNAGLTVYQFEKISREGAEILRSLAPDLMVTAAYGQLLSREILDIPKYGTLNVHGSLLPKYRGSAPIQRAIMDGLTRSGVTIMRTDEGMDTGDALAFETVEIERDDYVGDVYEKLADVGAKLLIKTIDGYVSGEISPIKQNDEEATYAPPLKKEDYVMDFSLGAEAVRNRIRGCGYGVCKNGEEPLKVYRLDLADGNGAAGEIIAADKSGITVACGSGAVKITELQASGKRRMNAADFLNGARLAAGDFLR